MQKKKETREAEGKHYIPFSPCVPPGFLLELEEGHLEGPGNKKGDSGGRTGKTARNSQSRNTNILATLSCTFTHAHTNTDSSQASGGREQSRSKHGPQKTVVRRPMQSVNSYWSVTREIEKLR